MTLALAVRPDDTTASSLDEQVIVVEREVDDGLLILREQYFKVGAKLEWLHSVQAWTQYTDADNRPIYTNWEEYIGQRFKLAGSYASRLRKAAKVYAVLPDGLKPQNEAQARELAKLDDEAKITAMQQAYEMAHEGKVTAGLIKRVVMIGDALVEEALATKGAVSVDGESVPIQAAVTERMIDQLNQELDNLAAKSGFVARTLVGTAEGPFAAARDNILKLLDDLAKDPRVQSGTLLHVRAYIPKAG